MTKIIVLAALLIATISLPYEDQMTLATSLIVGGAES
jgi:hypothetical protein